MASYTLTKKAVQDLGRIWEYTLTKWSEQQADRYYPILVQSFEDIANNPNLGKNYEGVSSQLYLLKASRHIIFYRIQPNQPIEITRILHERMDLKNRMGK